MFREHPPFKVSIADKNVRDSCRGGQVVSVLACYAYNPSLNPAEVCKFVWKERK